jgi:ATP-dependent phosphoenolpyruvate carboxykinase
MDITLTRTIIDAALNGGLASVPLRNDPLFHLQVPLHCPGVDDQLLDPPRRGATRMPSAVAPKSWRANSALISTKLIEQKNR